MVTTELDTLTDYLAKTNSTMFPVAEKLLYYNIAYGLLYAEILDDEEDTYESEQTFDTVSGQSAYGTPSRIHHINWLKIDYGDGFIPARPTTEQDLITEYGDALETTLTGWSASDPIYWYKGDHFFIAPAPTASQAGNELGKVSVELYPADLTAGGTPDLPETAHYLLAEFAAFKYHQNNGETEQAILREKNWKEGKQQIIDTLYPRSRQGFIQAHVPNDDGSTY